MSYTNKPPKNRNGVIPTKKGWVDAKTNELLVSVRINPDLIDNWQKNIQNPVDESIPLEPVKETSKEESANPVVVETIKETEKVSEEIPTVTTDESDKRAMRRAMRRKRVE